MTKQAIKLMRFRRLGIGIGAAWFALACGSGGKDKAPAEEEPMGGDGLPAQNDACADDPTLAGCEDTPPVTGPDGPAQPVDDTDEPGVEPPQAVCPGQLVTFDDLYAAVADDLGSLDDDDKLTTRYISLANRVTAGVCIEGALDRDRQALFKVINMLSTAPSIEEPLGIDEDQTLFRIDLADYEWDQPVTVVNADGSTTSFIDKWEAIAGNNPYAISYVGDEADDAVIDANTTVPLMLADSLLDAASIGNLYYALIGVNVQNTLDSFILNDLQIDVVQNLADEDQVRAGTANSKASPQDRMIQRDELGNRPGFLWQAFDFEDVSNESIFEDPFGFTEGGTEAIFTLENGLFGYIIADENSVIVEDSDILLDRDLSGFRATTAVSCSRCHAEGLITMVDEVRDFALENAVSLGLNNTERQQLEAIFPDAEELASIMEADSEGYRRALSTAGVTIGRVDPVAGVFDRFDRDMTLTDAAGDLGLTAEQLERNLSEIDPALQVLEDDALDRDTFTQFYLDSLCVVSSVNDNQPDPFVCTEALLAQ
jgi:hypothetical protein